MRIKKTKVILLLCTVALLVSTFIYYFDELGIKEIPLQDLKKKYEKSDSKYITIDGTKIHYCDQGKGPVIVALHGIVDSLHTWDKWVNVIGNHYRIVRMDMPGFGLTGPLQKGTYSKEMYVGFIDQFVTSLGIEKFILVGNSLGGAIAWNYAVQFPQKVNNMILIDPAGYPMKLPWPLKITEIPVIKNLATMMTPRLIFQMSLKQLFGDSSKVTDELVDRYYELALRHGNRKALLGIMENLKKLNNDPTFSKSITKITIPTLLLWGKKDSWIPVSHVPMWQKDVHGIHAIVYEGVGHVPQLEIPIQSANDAHKWLSAYKSKEKDVDDYQIQWIFFAGFGLLILILGVYFKGKKSVMR